MSSYLSIDTRVGRREFTALMAALMALNAFAIDTMLPALPAMGNSLGGVSVTAMQLVISAYLLGMGVGSLIHGPLADRLGRKPVLIGALVVAVALTLACAFVRDYQAMLALRFAHGMACAALGVVCTAVVRDLYEGDAMARQMSMIFLVFMAVPVLAPSVGAAILEIARWPMIFFALAALALMTGLWTVRRLPETLPPEKRQPINAANIWAGAKRVLSHRSAASYMIGSAIAHGALFGYLNSSLQIVSETFKMPALFPYVFAGVAVAIAISNFSNAHIVERFGARRVAHSAIMLFCLIGAIQVLAAKFIPQDFITFLIFCAINMGLIGFIGSNCGAIAMEPYGDIAGTASSIQSAVRTILSALIGAWIGQHFDGTAFPMAAGFLICGIAALGCVFFAERGRLFARPRTAPRPLPLESLRH
jgi:MFS transporter, DHA1 family, multidrug resistance protein